MKALINYQVIYNSNKHKNKQMFSWFKPNWVAISELQILLYFTVSCIFSTS